MDILHEMLADIIRSEFPNVKVDNYEYRRGTATELQIEVDRYELRDGDKVYDCRHAVEALITDDNHVHITTVLEANGNEVKERNKKIIPDDWKFVIGGVELTGDNRPSQMYDRPETVLDTYDPSFTPEDVTEAIKAELAKTVERLNIEEAATAQ